MEAKKTSKTAIQIYREVETITVPAETNATTPKRKRANPFGITAARKRNMTTVLLEVSSAGDDDDSDDWTLDEKYASSATQINADLALAAHYEAQEDISVDSLHSGFYELLHSPEFERLRARFVEEATADGGRCYAFQAAVWRGYIAGRVCPDRFVPRTSKQREKDRRLQREANAAILRRRELTQLQNAIAS